MDDVDGHWRNIVARTRDHPAVTRVTLGFTIDEGLTGLEKESFFGAQDVNALDSVFESLSRVEEERAFALSEFSHTQLGLSGFGGDWVQNDGVLARVKGGDGNFTNDTLEDVRNVENGVSLGDQPLFSGLSLDTIAVSEGTSGFQLQGLLVGQDNTSDGLDDFLVDVRGVGARDSDQPFFTGLTFNSVGVGKLRKMRKS